MAAQKKPRREPTVSTAWWNNEAFHGMLGAVKGALQGAVLGAALFFLCGIAGAATLGGLLFIVSFVGLTSYQGYSAYTRASVADKPKTPGKPKPYDPARTAQLIGTSIATTPPPPAPQITSAPAQTSEATKSELAGLSTRYQDALKRERTMAAGVENARN